ncbi:unnamed protein product, partial [Phaeothamnion confervicola]
QVRWEDQQCINEFGRLNTRFQELQREKKELKELVDQLDDASTELMTSEGASVQLMLGDCFVHCNEEYATDYCEKKQEAGQAQLDGLNEEEEGITKRQADLKKALYARFGSSIQLEA